ncbi:MAG: hypothetical protein Q8M09_12485 [Pseudomonadota bacterium]|nr:hypothetical protein [Pseudomonadota bacterium]MDP1905044.1 hypothetical protein [Pseudomonadota bacterium]MDP2354285.1 hypothetical protein [Pseudomonadota bacterium]
MTCRKDPMDPLSALYLVASKYPGGIPAIAGRLGVAASTLYALLRGDEAITLERAGQILHFSHQARVAGWAQPLHALAHEHGGVFVEVLPPLGEDADALTLAMLRAVSEFGDLAREAGADLADGEVTRRELREIEREAYEAIAAIMAFVELCRVQLISQGR